MYEALGEWLNRDAIYAKVLAAKAMQQADSKTSGTMSHMLSASVSDEFAAIQGPNARVPIYWERQMDWGSGTDENCQFSSVPGLGMNKVGRIWQFIANPVVLVNRDDESTVLSS